MPATARPTQAHSHAGGQAGAKPKLYNPRHPERTLLYQTIAEHFETWHELASAGQFDGQGDHHTPKPYVRQAFRKYLECGIFAHGFARAWCDDCGHDYFVAYSCKGRGVCPSCNTRRMVDVDRPHLRSFAVAVPAVRWSDAPDRLHYRGHADQEDPRSHRRRLRTSAYFPGARATVVMRRRMTGRKSSPQTGIWRRKRHRTLRLISASVGEGLRG